MSIEPIKRELLELAAKAHGFLPLDESAETGTGLHRDSEGQFLFYETSPVPRWRNWNPITDDGDNAKLEAKLGINIEWMLYGVIARPRMNIVEHIYERYMDHDHGKQAARRLATVRAAAAMGKAMP